MTSYRVEVDDDVVWEEEHDDYQTLGHFPDEYKGRPESGTVRLYVDDECVSVSVPISETERLAVEQQRRIEAIDDPELEVN